MEDAKGALITLLRSSTAVTAIVAGRVGAYDAAPPSVRIRAMPASRRPFGPGSGRLGMQLFRAVAQCYGDDSPTGQVLARQLAGVVSDFLHNRGPATVGSTFIARMYASEISEALRDPDSKRPCHTVRVELYAADQPVA